LGASASGTAELVAAEESPPAGAGRADIESPTTAAASARTRRWVLSIMSRLSEAVRSLTSNKANTDVPPDVSVPAPEQGAVPMPDREPMVGFEPERES
jgi:hypothetical protein